MSDDQKQHPTEKRSVSTIFNGKNLTIILPLLVAIGAGYINFERTLHSTKAVVDEHSSSLTLMQKELFSIQSMLGQLLSLNTKIVVLTSKQKEIQKLESELVKVVALLEQRIEYGDGVVEEVRQRLRKLEQSIAKMQ